MWIGTLQKDGQLTAGAKDYGPTISKEECIALHEALCKGGHDSMRKCREYWPLEGDEAWAVLYDPPLSAPAVMKGHPRTWKGVTQSLLILQRGDAEGAVIGEEYCTLFVGDDDTVQLLPYRFWRALDMATNPRDYLVGIKTPASVVAKLPQTWVGGRVSAKLEDGRVVAGDLLAVEGDTIRVRLDSQQIETLTPLWVSYVGCSKNPLLY